jgi:RNA recognition motif-containing protein
MNPTRLFVGKLSYQTGENDLQDYFAQAGAVTSGNLMVDKVTGKPAALRSWNLPTPKRRSGEACR